MNILISYSAGGLVISRHRKVLFVQEYGHYWGLPRGHIEAGESNLEAALREIEEESGLTEVEFICELGRYQRSTFGPDGLPNNGALKDIVFFLFTSEELMPSPMEPAITKAEWLLPEDARARLINSDDQKFFRKCLEDERVKRLLSQ